MTPTAELPPDIEEDQEQPEDTAAEDYGPDNRYLPEQLVNAIKAAIKEFSEQEKFTRRREVMRDRRNRFYERGIQHIRWNDRQGGFVQGTPGGVWENSAGETAQLPQYIDDWDIFGPYLWILIAILTQNPPGVNFQPIDPTVPDDIDKARAAESYAYAFDRMNDSKEIQTEIVRMMGLSGRVVSWTRTEQDVQKFGNANGGIFQRTTIHGTLETRVPLLARKLDKDFLYCFIYDDPDIKSVKDEYDWELKDGTKVADKIKADMPALGENNYERTARLGVLNGSRSRAQIGDSLTHLGSRLNAFLRPAAFTGDLYDNPFTEGRKNADGKPMTVKEKLKQLFPGGCRARFVGDEYTGSFAESMDDHIDIRFPFPGDGMFRKAIMDPMVVVQDGFNDSMNASRENFDTGWPSTWVNADESEYDAITSQKAAPNAIRQKKVRTGMKLSEEFFHEGNAELPATFVEFIQMLRAELPQFMLAAPPALFGAAMEDQKTASGYAQARSQAMGRLGLVWQSIQHMWARIRYQSALAASQNDQQTGTLSLSAGKDQPAVTVNLDALKKGNFGCYADEDSSFPESTQQKRATLGNLLTMAGQSPAMMQMMDTPQNVEQVLRLNGFEELEFPEAEAWRKQISEIEELLKQPPLPPEPAAVAGAMVDHAAGHVAAAVNEQPGPPPLQAPPLESTIQVDVEMDFHAWEWAAGQVWWSSAAKREQEEKGNLGGLQNVRLHLLAHRAAMVAMMPPPLAPGAGVPKPSPKGPPVKPALGAPVSSGPPPAPAAPPALPI